MATASRLHSAMLLLFAAGGIYASYLTQGVLQEKLSTKRYGAHADRFPHLTALAGVQSVVCFLWAAALLAIFPPAKAPSKDKATSPPPHAFWKAGLTNAIGPACGMQALKNISYPAQVGGCCIAPIVNTPAQYA